ncbi:MAG: UDP-N-acetylmuramoyl-tripeptide--D-alanyl-D-alanine ligase [Candidatus Moranbacteria bacterium]|jgi:UDP-N-acetylmuramoyl-tripeptide--D-alanyl-D-alanine ligase|nr:UDP-N-acetylmuramoyl-tripeptide--D-alanyl-D-alanine ligase [Candidatus Moranbacteria bacterium]
MKSKKIIYLERILRFMAAAILKRHKPQIVGITGSVGKSSAKEAVFLVLKDNFKVRKNEENYNNEIGIPLTIIGAKTGGKNLFKWSVVFLKWIFWLIAPAGYPKILILEMAIDRPGDMKYLMSFIPLNVGILTNVSSSHLEFFKNIKAIAKEKSILVKSISKSGVAILNTDNPFIREESDGIKAQVISYGFNEGADIKVTDVRFNYDEAGNSKGLSFKLNFNKKIIPLRLPRIIAKHHLYAALAAVGVGEYFKINMIDALGALENFQSPLGRMNLIPGINKSLIIDDTYNASPVSTLAALSTMEQINAKRKIVILGDMFELGEDSEAGHMEVVKTVLEGKFDKFISVGKRMHKATQDLLGNNNSIKSVLFFDNPIEAGKIIKNTIQEGDLILVKGSQGMRMEKVIEEIIDSSEEVEKILCRQSKRWKKKDFVKN